MVDRIAAAAGFARPRGVRGLRARSRPARRASTATASCAPLPGAPAIDEDTLRQPGHIVAMAGAEPIQDALDARRRRRAARPVRRRRDLRRDAARPRLRPRTGVERGQDRRVRVGRGDQPQGPGLDPVHHRGRRLRARAARSRPALHARRSVAAHTLYETADPYRLIMPSGTLDARTATYEALDDRRVKVRGGTFTAGRRVHRQARGRGAGRLPVVVLGVDARPGDPRPAPVVVRVARDADPHAAWRATWARPPTGSTSRCTAPTARSARRPTSCRARP